MFTSSPGIFSYAELKYASYTGSLWPFLQLVSLSRLQVPDVEKRSPQ
jgi:hypothetical protein